MANKAPQPPRLGPRDMAWGGLLAAAAATLYLSFLTKSYVFEGLARAMPIETGRFRGLFNGNYLIYGFLGWCFHGLLQILGSTNTAVLSLQIMDSLIGSMGLFVFFLALRFLGAGRLSAAACAAVLGLSLGYWSWSTDAQNYIFSTFLLELNFLFLVLHATGRRIPPAWLGALHALAVLGHIVNLLFGFVTLWFLAAAYGRSWRGPVARYAAAAAAGVLGAYALALGAIVRPHTAGQALHWFFGSFSAGEAGWHWHGSYGLAPLGEWLRMTVNILVSFAPEYHRPPAWGWSRLVLAAARALAALFVLRLALRARELSGPRRTVAVGCGIWLLAYAAVFASWEPHTMVYRVSDLVPIAALLFLGAEGSSPSPPWRAGSLLLASLLGLGNFAAEIYPRSFVQNNPRLMRMEFLKTHTAGGDWIAAAESDAGNDELYIPFFAERRPILLASYRRRPQDLDRLLGLLLSSGRNVWVSSRVLADEFWSGYFRGYGLELLAQDEEGFGLYRLSRRR